MRVGEMRRIFKSLLLRSVDSQNSLKNQRFWLFSCLRHSEYFRMPFEYSSRPFAGWCFQRLNTFLKASDRPLENQRFVQPGNCFEIRHQILDDFFKSFTACDSVQILNGVKIIRVQGHGSPGMTGDLPDALHGEVLTHVQTAENRFSNFV